MIRWFAKGTSSPRVSAVETNNPKGRVGAKDARLRSARLHGTARRVAVAALAASAVFAGLAAVPQVALAEQATTSIYRLYNPYSGEHLFTTNEEEYEYLPTLGWTAEEVAWEAPTEGTAVYRLYNPYSGDHHYTTDEAEYDYLATLGWNQEDVAFYSADAAEDDAEPVYRLYNPWLTVGTHLFTTDAAEQANLVSLGWDDESVAFYGLAAQPTSDVPTWDELADTFALNVETEGLSADELLAKGKAYEQGNGVPQWYSMAMAYYEAARDAGSTEAGEAIETLNAFKAEVQAEGDQGRMFTFFRNAVTETQKVDTDYQKVYAIYYDDSFFFQDPENRGLLAMGDLLLNGNGVEQDIQKAMKVYQYCAKVLHKGNAYTSLGLVYDTSQPQVEGYAKSDETALAYYLLSGEGDGADGFEPDFKGPRRAADILDRGYTKDDGTVVAPDYLKAEQYYLLATTVSKRSVDVTAYYKLGTYYEEGRYDVDGNVIVAQDYAKAAECYLKVVNDKSVHATQLGVPQTYLSLARFYENGTGVEQDLATAKDYYVKARDAALANMTNSELAGYDAAKAVYDEATAALERLNA